MGKLIIIGAVGKNGELGRNNSLIWHLKGDLEFFKNVTINHKILMGYNTFLSLPKLLPKRVHIVLTHKEINLDGVIVFNDFDKLLSYLNALEEDVYIIGGDTIYQLFLPFASELILTRIDDDAPDADVYFPEFNLCLYDEETLGEKVEDKIHYKHVLLRRKKI